MPLTYTPSSTYHATPDELAITDVTLGGSGGAANVPHEDLADSIKYLYDQRFTDAKQSFESLTGGRATILVDDNGNWNYMAKIPKFKPSDLDSDLGSDGNYHPAFYVNTVLKDFIYVALFQAHENSDGDLVSQPLKAVKKDTFSNHVAACAALGTGWHMMTIHERSALSLLSLKNVGTLHGCTAAYSSHLNSGERGFPDPAGSDEIYSGSGPVEWNHDLQPFGVADLVGNYQEWANLIKIVDNKFYFPVDNYHTLAEGSWTDQGFYYYRTVATTGDIMHSDTYGADNVFYDKAWSSVAYDAGFFALSVMSTSLLCDLLISTDWSDGGAPTSPTLIASTPGLVKCKLETGTKHMTIGGSAAFNLTGADAGLGAMMPVTGATTAACRLVYIP